jgi:K+-sensing histidine kinase KdpD
VLREHYPLEMCYTAGRRGVAVCVSRRRESHAVVRRADVDAERAVAEWVGLVTFAKHVTGLVRPRTAANDRVWTRG